MFTFCKCSLSECQLRCPPFTLCRAKSETQSDSHENNSDTSSSKEETQELLDSGTCQTEPTDSDITAFHTNSNLDSDLHTHGYRPSALQDSLHSSSGSSSSSRGRRGRRVSSGSELGIILEHQESHDSDEVVLGSVPDQTNEMSSSARCAGTIEMEGKQVQSTQVQHHKHIPGQTHDITRLLKEDSPSLDFDISEGMTSLDEGINNVREDGRLENGALSGEKVCTGEERHGSLSQDKHTPGRRRSSFLVPFFDRRESFTLSFFKPSLSALRRREEQRKHHHHVTTRKHDRSHPPQEDVEGMEGGGEGGEDSRRKVDKIALLGRKARAVMKNTFLNLRLFFWLVPNNSFYSALCCMFIFS